MLKNKLFFLMIVFVCITLQGCKKQGNENIKIGLLAPLTRCNANLGTSVRAGVKLYIDEYNSKKNSLQKKIILEEYDEEDSSNKAIDGFNALYDRGVSGIIGGVISAPTLAVAPLTNECNMPFIAASASAEDVTYDSKTKTFYENIFRICFINRVQGEKMADFSKNELMAKTACVLYSPENDYSADLKNFFVKKCKKNGIKILLVESFQENTVDFQSQLSNIASKNPDVLFVPHYYERVALIVNQAREQKIVCPLIGCDAWYSTQNYLKAKPQLLDGCFYSSAYSSEQGDENSKKFLSAYLKKFKKDPNMYNAEGYDSAKTMVLAIEKALEEEKTNYKTNFEEFKKRIIAFLKTTQLDGVTGKIQFDAKNNSDKGVVIIKFENNEEKFWGTY